MSNLIGQSLGRYHILEKLGEGGMATVYKAYDTRLERDIAIKVIRRGAFPPEQLERILMRFEQEARLIAKLSHPNIVKLLDYGVYEGSPYHVLEYIPAGTLKKLLEQRAGKQMPWREAARLLLPIAQALEYAHEHKIIHRDIKPSNILLTEKGQPILSDFGIAKPLDIEATHTLTGAGVGIGTAAYMSPEQGLGKKIDGRTDVYSLGIVYYELITGRTPFTADTPQAVIDKQIHDPLPRPAQYVTGLPEKVEHLLLKALAKAPENRYPGMGAFVKALEALLGYPTQVVGLIQDTEKTVEQLNEETTQDDLELDSDGTTIPEPVLPPKSWLKWLLVTGVIAFLCLALAASGGYLIWRNATPAAASLAPITDSPMPTETASSIAQIPITDAPTRTVTQAPEKSSTQASPIDKNVIARSTTSSEINSIPSIWVFSGIDNPGDIPSPGSKYYETVVDSSSAMRWMFFWCTSDSATLTQNLNYMAVNLLINDVPLGMDQIYQYDESSSHWYCRYWSTTLSDWVGGAIIKLTVHYTFFQAINDGYSTYPSGDYYLQLEVAVR